VNSLPKNNVPEPIPERLQEAVWRAEDTGDPATLGALSLEDSEIVVHYLEGIRANITQILDALSATRR
jgi:hypothetical protein